MRTLLEAYGLNSIDDFPCNSEYPIWQKHDVSGRVYWGIGSFCGMDRQPIDSTRDLSQLEWDGNEVHLGSDTEGDVAVILRKAIGILSFWKSELENRFPGTSFYLFASYDDGAFQILDEGESPVKSVTLRFWADRGDNTVVNLEAFEYWDQPAILDYVSSGMTTYNSATKVIL